jgi:predicted DCC family thiol-disulfide oxidoreductase YuxK
MQWVQYTIMTPERSPDLLFYDGTCGLCHRTVRFVVARDLDASRFRFAPLGGGTFRDVVPVESRVDLPDSVVVRTADGRILVRSAAVLHIGERLGGPWRILARIASLMPRWLLDLGYDGLARIRVHLFAKPEGVCPMLPVELRTRFLP